MPSFGLLSSMFPLLNSAIGASPCGTGPVPRSVPGGAPNSAL